VRRAALGLALVTLLLPLVVAGLAPAASAEPRPRPHPLPRAKALPLPTTDCTVIDRRAVCGSIQRPWEPGNPAAGTVRVGFAFVPARRGPALGTLVPHEGGPGYSTTGTAAAYAAMYGPLLERRNLLLVDQRGTGLSGPIHCPALQDLRMAYRLAAGRCGRKLGDRADDYTTALSADDLAAVVRRLDLGRVDVYGDSYGTFFAQVFAGRHPGLVRSVVLDSAYPTHGESAFYPTQAPAMRRAFGAACRRSAACRDGGLPFGEALDEVLGAVRATPWRGTAYDADGTRTTVVVDGRALVTVAFGATYTPAFYRELTAALRAALDGDRRPLLRLVAEATGGGTDAGPAYYYSEGLDAAVACHDYPQLYDMTAPPGVVREEQYAAALASADPATYAPFSVAEYAASDWQALDWCTRWPTAPSSNPAGPPVPPAGSYSGVPVLVLSGELDSITTAAEGDLVTAQFPNARHVVVRNSFHVTAVGDTDDCAVRIVRAFVARPSAPLAKACAKDVPPVRALGSFPRPVGATAPARRVARLAALTVADLPDRWWNNYSGHGVGLSGGTFTYAGDRVVTFRIAGYSLVRGLNISGRAVWDRYGETMTVDLTLRSHGRTGRLAGSWDTRSPGARVTLTGGLGSDGVRVTVPAP
jgi:pimeloyl-ACP methyl ester carboxylesterase